MASRPNNVEFTIHVVSGVGSVKVPIAGELYAFSVIPPAANAVYDIVGVDSKNHPVLGQVGCSGTIFIGGMKTPCLDPAHTLSIANATADGAYSGVLRTLY